MSSSSARIGMSLTPRYLAGDVNAVEHRIYGPVDAFLADLRSAGVCSIELRMINPGSNVEQSLAALKRVRAAGFAATIHGALPPQSAGADWQHATPAMVALMQQLDDATDPPCPMTVHAHAEAVGDEATLADSTVDRLQSMADWIEREKLPVTLALELNRIKSTVDPSCTYESVLDMVRRTDRPGVRICWDFGHTWANVLTQSLSPDAPTDFAADVRHTHIHDLGSTGKTHWPLTEQRLPLDRFVAALQAANYTGVWNLELSPERFESEGSARQRTLNSCDHLRNAITANAQVN